MASNINPNNIDGAYPVAGQDNNSQGFRDNFTNIKQNFQYTEDEINDLQNKAVLKAALTGTTLDNNMNDNLIYAAKIQDFSATRVQVTPTGAPLTATLNYASGHYQTFSTTGSTVLAFSNWPAAGSYGYFRIQVNITNVAHTITTPASVSLGLAGIQGISPGTSGVSNTITFGAAGVYEFAFSSSDGGATITLFDLNRALTNFTAADIQTDDVSATGFVSAVGNVTGGNLRTAGTVSSTGNVIGGNITTVGQVVSTGNITGGNINTAGALSTTGTVTGLNVVGYIYPRAGTVSAPAVQFTSGTVLGTATAGTLEYDGVSFYTTPTSGQRGVTALNHYVMTPASNYTLTQNTSAQKVFASTTGGTAGAVALPASTSYLMEAMYYITNTGTTSHSLSTLFNVTSALTSISYTADVTTSSGAPTAGATTVSRSFGVAPTALQITPTGTTTASENIIVVLRGIIRTNGTTTLTPQVQFNTNAPGGTSTVLVNSYFTLTPIGTSSATSVGNWS